MSALTLCYSGVAQGPAALVLAENLLSVQIFSPTPELLNNLFFLSKDRGA